VQVTSCPDRGPRISSQACRFATTLLLTFRALYYLALVPICCRRGDVISKYRRNFYDLILASMTGNSPVAYLPPFPGILDCKATLTATAAPQFTQPIFKLFQGKGVGCTGCVLCITDAQQGVAGTASAINTFGHGQQAQYLVCCCFSCHFGSSLAAIIMVAEVHLPSLSCPALPALTRRRVPRACTRQQLVVCIHQQGPCARPLQL
jgi:hypothetical protein